MAAWHWLEGQWGHVPPVLSQLASTRWNYVLRSLPNIEAELEHMEHVVCKVFLPAFSGQSQLGEQMRNLLALPARISGMGLINPVMEAGIQYTTS